jgi:hypothetical protein
VGLYRRGTWPCQPLMPPRPRSAFSRALLSICAPTPKTWRIPIGAGLSLRCRGRSAWAPPPARTVETHALPARPSKQTTRERKKRRYLHPRLEAEAPKSRRTWSRSPRTQRLKSFGAREFEASRRTIRGQERPERLATQGSRTKGRSSMPLRSLMMRVTYQARADLGGDWLSPTMIQKSRQITSVRADLRIEGGDLSLLPSL